MKFSKLEKLTLCFTALTLSFLGGWFACRQHQINLQFVPSSSEPTTETAAPLPQISEAPSEKKININTATKEELMTLPGIGDKRSDDIIAFREENGPFPVPEAITDVPGIGASTLAEILDYITTAEE